MIVGVCNTLKDAKILASLVAKKKGRKIIIRKATKKEIEKIRKTNPLLLQSLVYNGKTVSFQHKNRYVVEVSPM